MRALFVGDVHNHSYIFEDIKKLDDKYHFDRIIFTGDYVDDWITDNHQSLETLETVINLKRSNPEKYTFCIGNHELSYLGYPCSGHRYELDDIMNMKLKDNIDCFDLYTIVTLGDTDYVCTHAGINNDYVKHVLQGDWREELKKLNKDKLANLYLTTMCSYLRGGYNEFSSFLWCDKREHEYLNRFEERTIPYQIVGHTPVETITALSSENYTTYFIDTHSTYKDGSEYGDKSYLFWNENQFEYLKRSEIDENKK